MGKEDKKASTKIGDAIKSTGYRVRKYIYEKAVEKSAQASKDLEQRKEEYREASKQNGFFSDFRANSAEEKVARTRRGLDRWNSVRYSLRDKVEGSKSAAACLDRFTDEKFYYSTLKEMVSDRATIEAFRPSGKSTFDSMVPLDKASYGKAFIGSALDIARSGEMVSTIEQAKVVLALGDAKMLSQETSHEDGSKSTYGQDLVDYVISIREEERQNAADVVKSKDDMEIFKRNDDQLATLQEQATVITTSAQEYYASLMAQMGEDQEQ